MLIRARHYATGEPTEITYSDGTIVHVSRATPVRADREAGWVAPALFDLQINGCRGISFNSPTLTGDEVRTVVDECRRHGIGGLLPTLVTNSFDAIAHGFRTLRRACETDPA